MLSINAAVGSRYFIQACGYFPVIIYRYQFILLDEQRHSSWSQEESLLIKCSVQSRMGFSGVDTVVGWLLNKKAVNVEVNISLAFLHWLGIALHSPRLTFCL